MTDQPTFAIHFRATDDVHSVALNHIRVLLLEEEDGWIAQGLELDYAAAGVTPEDVKRRFEDGLGATISAHLQAFGGIEGLLKVAPQDVWNQWLTADKRYSFQQVSVHDLSEDDLPEDLVLPFRGIAYMEHRLAA